MSLYRRFIFLLAVTVAAIANAEPNIDLANAAKRGDVFAVAAALKAGAKLDAKFDVGRTALIIAAMRGHAPVVEVLLNAGADMYAQDNNNVDALMTAVMHKHPAVVRALLNRGFDPALNDWRVLSVVPDERARGRRDQKTDKDREIIGMFQAHKEKGGSTRASPAPAPSASSTPDAAPAPPIATIKDPLTMPAPSTLGMKDHAPPVTIDTFGQKITPEVFKAAASRALVGRGWKITGTGDNGLVGTLMKDRTYKAVVAYFPPVIVISYEKGYGHPRQNWLLNIRKDLLVELSAAMVSE